MALNFPTSPTPGQTFTEGDTTGSWNGIAWNLVGAASVASSSNNFTTFSADSGSTSANIVNDTLIVAGGTDISTAISGDTLTVNYTGVGGGGGSDQNIYETVTGDSGTTTANTTTDTLNIVGGSNIITAVTDDTVTINYSGASPSTSFTTLSDVPSGLTVDKIYMPAIAMLTVDNNGTSAYTFASHYTGDNPTIYALSGTTLAFDLANIGGHPFQIQDPTSTPYNTGLVHVTSAGVVTTGASANGKTGGTLYWQVPFGISGGYRYQCTSHASMVGLITIKAFNAI